MNEIIVLKNNHIFVTKLLINTESSYQFLFVCLFVCLCNMILDEAKSFEETILILDRYSGAIPVTNQSSIQMALECQINKQADWYLPLNTGPGWYSDPLCI